MTMPCNVVVVVYQKVIMSVWRTRVYFTIWPTQLYFVYLSPADLASIIIGLVYILSFIL